MRVLIVVFFIAVITLAALNRIDTWKYEKNLGSHIKNTMDQIDGNAELIDNNDDQSGQMHVVGVSQPFTEQWIHQYLQTEVKDQDTSSIFTWRWADKDKIAMSAMGLDHKHHFVNSYLLGFLPFKVENAWEPLYTLTLKKKYQYDHLQYSGLKDVWQNARQAFYYTRGDCEDHAIILADWLISSGYDAKVALGMYKTTGHAWVILYLNGQEYLLEATLKEKKRSGPMRLAVLETDYNPGFLFNRTEFWIKPDSLRTTRYSGKIWKKVSTFEPFH